MNIKSYKRFGMIFKQNKLVLLKWLTLLSNLLKKKTTEQVQKIIILKIKHYPVIVLISFAY